jgi:5-methylcytosine-specific restriction endonuclease McrA
MAYKNLEKKLMASRKGNKKYYDKMRADPILWKKYLNRCSVKRKRWQKRRTFVKLIHWLKSRLKSRNNTINGILVKGNITPLQLFGIAKKQKLICVLTGRKLTTENISLDHIIPLSISGDNTIDNVRLVVKDVNFAKQQLLDDDFVKLCQDVVNHHIPKA